MGMFVNALPLRLQINADASFAALLRSVHETVTTALRYPEVPFEELVRALNLPRDATRFPIYQTMFSFQDARGRQQRWGALEHEMIHVTQPHLAEDVALWFLEKSDGIVGALNYRTDLIDAGSATLLQERFEDLLHNVIAAPLQALAMIALPAAERECLMRWGSNPQLFPQSLSIDALLAHQALTCGARVAVRDGAIALTYAELMQHVDAVALALRARGIGAGDRVGLGLQRGHAMLTALLGILRSGAAYVPLDPSYPPSRLSYMAADAALALLLTNAGTGSGGADTSDGLAWMPRLLPVMTLDALLATPLPAAPLPNTLLPAVAASADAIAYVIYTSGSTGTPKGVQVTHRAVVNFLSSMRRQPGISATDRLLAVTTLSFDIAVLELLLPLAAGAEVVLASREQAGDAQALATLLVDSGATMMQATPATWHMLLTTGWTAPAGFRGLVGGEALAPTLASALLAQGMELWNMYGPTETTVWSTCWRVPADPGGMRIGGPIANTTLRILNPQGRLCPIGTIGELWIGGAGVSAGYLHQPALSAARFIADPFAADASARLYRTGDLARWHSDGSLEHLGRNDDQIKVRGFRIEPGDIEAVLMRDTAVARCIVVARQDTPGDVRLVAYVVAHDPQTSAATLRAACIAALPAYMVPQHVVLLPALPTLPNGKIDRAALPPPARSTSEHRPDPTLPVELMSATELLLQAVWQNLLQTPAIRVQDNFFDLGGHSLLVMQAIQAMAVQTGKRVNPGRFIFESLRQVAQAYDDIAIEKPRVGLIGRLFSGWSGKETS